MTATTVTDGGVETDLIHHHGVELPEFAAFPLLETEHGRALLTYYYAGYAQIARAAGAALLLEGGTWRANPDWGAKLGYDAAGLHRANVDAMRFLARLRDDFGVPGTRIGGTVGPRGDGYRPGERTDPADAAAYHRPQLDALAEGGADLATAYTLTDPGEAIGIVLAARGVGLPVAISFTVETDGRLPGGTTLAGAISTVDAAAAPDYFLVNCAHPTHVAGALAEGGAWLERIHGLRCNASAKSHAELDEATELDEGNPAEFAAAHRALLPLLPKLAILGGCCGTDTRHVAALWNT